MGQISFQDIVLGGDAPLFAIAGPCVIEDGESCLDIARAVKEVTENLGALGWEISNVDLAEVDAILDRHGAVTVPPGWLED